MDDVVSTVDALVSDEPTTMSYPYGIDSPLRSGTPSFPPGFGHMQPMQHPTPPPPPGFSRPMTPATSMTPVTAMTPSNLSQQAFPRPPVPVVPIVDLAPAKERAETPKPQEEEKPQPVQPPIGKKATRVASLASNASSVTAPVEGVKAVKAPEAAPVAVPTPAPVVAQEAPAVAPTAPPATPLKLTKKNSVLQDEDFPALDAASASATKPSASTLARASKPSTPVGKKTAEKRPVPAVLNLAAVGKPAVIKAAEASPALSDKHTTADMSSAFPSLPTPAAPWSPAVRAPPAPKTLRVVQTPKAESGPAPVLSLAAITAAENAKLAAASNLASSSSTPTLTSAVLVNRQASLSNRPSTPASEIVSLSDNASVVSASISASRAGSPPPQPTRIGSAAVRNTTKSQQRKQRKQASKMDAAAVVEAATTTSTSFADQALNEQDEEAVEIAPLMGRKKKQKKEKPAPAPAPVAAAPAEAPATETASAAASAKAQKEEKEAKEKAAKEKEAKEAKETKERAKQSSAAKKKEDAKEKAAAAAAAEAATKAAAAAAADKAKSSTKATTATAAAASATADATAESSAAAAAANATVSAPLVQVQKLFEKEQEALRKVLREAAEVAGSTTLSVVQNDVAPPVKSDSPPPGGTIRSVALDLAARGMIDKRLENISFLQPFVTLAQSRNVTRNTVIKGDALLPPDVLFSKDDLNDIVAGKAVRKYVDDVRLLATPNGDCLRNLTEAEENRFMTLQARLGNSLASPLSYMHSRYEETGGFDLIAKRAVPCGLPSYYPVKALAPAGVAGQMIFDPMSKIQREEAVYWINQYVLPRLNLLPQSEAASWQSMLVDTGVPQAIGTTTLAPWIYHTPEMRYGMPASGFSSSSIPTSSIVTNGNGTAHAYADDRRESTSSNNTDGGPTLGDHSNGSNHNSALTYTNGQSSVSSAHSSRSNGGPSGLIVDRDSVDLKNDLESSVHAMSVEDAERSLIEARREAKIYERALVQLIKMNGRLLLMSDESFAKIAGGSSSSSGGGGHGSDAGPFDRSSPTPVVTTAY